MRKICILILFFCLTFAFEAKASSLNYTQKLFFGKYIPTSSSGSLTLSTAGTITSANGVQTFQMSGYQALANYKASGLGGLLGLLINISVLESSVVLTSNVSGAPNVIASNFAVSPVSITLSIPLFSSGATLDNIRLGGTLNFSSYPRGTYTGNVTMRVVSTLGLVATAQSTIPIEVIFMNILGVTEKTSLNFGAIDTKGTSSGTVRMLPSGTRSILSGTNLWLSSGGGTPNAGSFDITGEPNQLINIVLPSSAILNNGKGNTIMLSSFSRQPSGSVTLNNNGDTNLKIGADVAIVSGQATGTYTGTYTIQVNY